MNRSALRLNFAKKTALAVAGIAALAAPVIVGVMNAPFIRAQSTATAPLKFEIAFINLCADASVPRGGRGRSGVLDVVPVTVDSKGAFQFPNSSSTGRLHVTCQSVTGLIQAAYVLFANGNLAQSVPIEGGPAWVRSDRYDLDATAQGAPSRDVMMGPMLQALLEEKYRLKIHRETREVPVYALTVAAGGLKLPQFQEGSCVPIAFTTFRHTLDRSLYSGQALEPVFQSGVNFCPNLGSAKGSLNMVEAQGTSLDEFSEFFLSGLDRPVVNKTGLTGLFNIHLEFASTGDAGGPSIFTAFQEQLGLKLEPATGPQEFLVIDHVERPSGN